MFYGYDREKKYYTTRAHLAEVIELLGPPPLDLVQRGLRSPEFFTEDGKSHPLAAPLHVPVTYLACGACVGKWKADIPITEGRSLEESEENLEGDNKKEFLTFMRKMLQWRPEDRKTAGELLEDPWLNRY